MCGNLLLPSPAPCSFASRSPLPLAVPKPPGSTYPYSVHRGKCFCLGSFDCAAERLHPVWCDKMSPDHEIGRDCRSFCSTPHADMGLSWSSNFQLRYMPSSTPVTSLAQVTMTAYVPARSRLALHGRDKHGLYKGESPSVSEIRADTCCSCRFHSLGISSCAALSFS